MRAFLPIWVFLYVLQFLLMPLIAQDYWVSNFFGNTMYLTALSYYFVITFLGYNGVSPISRWLFPTVSLIPISSSVLRSHRGSTHAHSCPCYRLASKPLYI